MIERHEWITYWHWLGRLGWLWRLTFCRLGVHLWDEVYTWDHGRPLSYLNCDSCNRTVRLHERGLFDEESEVD